MGDLADGESTTVKGSGSSIYTMKNIGGVYSCTCPAWMHQSLPIEKRTCKHLRAYRGDDAEATRLGSAGLLSGKPARAKANGEAGDNATEEPPLLLAHKWETDIDVTGWWMSEKLDGVRAYWDGKQFLSRLGNKFHPPDWFLEGFPDTPLDGELWGGRKKFQRTVGIVKRQDKADIWKEIMYLVFDAPDHGGGFEERLEACRTTVQETQTPWARVHHHEVCRDIDHLKKELARVEGLGGEGLMMRKPKSKYEPGRSTTLLKVKTFHDAEARVLEHVAGAGKHKGRLGALLVELQDGTRFNVGTGFSDKEREEPPEIGTLITFRYQELSDGGVPRFPSFVGVRDDVKWEDARDVKRNGPAKTSAPVIKPLEKTLPSATFPEEEKTKPIPVSQPSPRHHRKRRRFECVIDGERLFWEIEVDGDRHRVRFGTFEAKMKQYENEEEAAEAAIRRIEEKMSKGFEEVDD